MRKNPDGHGTRDPSTPDVCGALKRDKPLSAERRTCISAYGSDRSWIIETHAGTISIVDHKSRGMRNERHPYDRPQEC
jgi:hypothetical protein